LPSSQERRGFPGRRIEQPTVRSSQPPSQRDVRQATPQTRQIRQTPATRTPVPVIRREDLVTPRVQSGRPDLPQRPTFRDTPFRGIGEGSFERRAGERGGTSNLNNIMRQRSRGSSGEQIQQRQDGRGSSGGSSDSGSRGGSSGGSSGSGSRGSGQDGDSRR
jgi:hypothetical protein